MYGYGSSAGTTNAVNIDRETLAHRILPSFASTGFNVKVMRGHMSRYTYSPQTASVTSVRWKDSVSPVLAETAT